MGINTRGFNDLMLRRSKEGPKEEELKEAFRSIILKNNQIFITLLDIIKQPFLDRGGDMLIE